MNKIRLPILITTVSLILTAILVLQAYQHSTGAQQKVRSRTTGMGDLRRFEGQQAGLNAGAGAVARVGMGDLRRFEAGLGASTPARVCPSLSTPSGERDAGVSAPAYVLRALGCPVPPGR